MASTVQTATADGGFEEQEINKEQVDAVNKRNAHKPLFEQLRQNQEEEQAKQEEMQREMMRGTMALDDDDVAHLGALQQQRTERERAIQQRTQEELMLFRAAKAERQQIELEDENDDETEGGASTKAQLAPDPALAEAKKKPATLAPKIVVKKRKRRVDPAKDIQAKSEEHAAGKKTKQESIQVDNRGGEKVGEAKEAPSAGLSGLLSGYGSSDDDSD